MITKCISKRSRVVKSSAAGVPEIELEHKLISAAENSFDPILVCTIEEEDHS